MIQVSSPLKRDWIKDFVGDLEFDGQKYNFIEEKGINILFEIKVDDLEAAAKHLKSSIKSSDLGNILYFSVKVI